MLHGEDVPAGEELALALTALHPPSVHGHEAGIVYLENPAVFRGRKVAVVISGGNIDFKLLAELVDRYSVAS